MKHTDSVSQSSLSKLFTMENGKKFSSGWLSLAIYGAFKKPLNPEPLELEVYDYVMRRVNQGPAFDAMVKAIPAALAVLDSIRMGEVPEKEREALRAALNLARRSK